MISLLLALAAPAFAAEPSLLKSRPASALTDEVIELRPASGHHFNPAAPQKCGGERALEVVPRRFRCQLTKPGPNEVLVSVCDDAETFCRQESFTVSVSGLPKKEAKLSPIAAAPNGGRPAPAGFLDNEPAKARSLARREDRLILVDFYGIWCPPCNQLEEESYPDASFQKASADFVKVGLDADAETSFDWKTHFKVGGYPTLIVADAGLREIGRVVGARSGPALAKFLEQTKELRDEPVERAAELVAKGGADATPLRRLRVAHWRAERAEFDAVESLLAGMSDPASRRELLLARRERARLADDDAARLAQTKLLLAEFPRDSAFADWAADLAAADKAAAEPLRAAVRASVDAWASSPALGETDYALGDLLSEEATFFDALGSTDEAKALWSKTADAYAAEAKLSPLKVPRAANFGLADALLAAGRKDEAKALYKTLVAAYPDEFTFNYDFGTVLNDDGDAASAEPYAAKAVTAAYGDNWLRAVRLKASVELKLGKTAQAAKTIDDALAVTAPPKSSAVRTYRYLAALRKLRAEIAAKKS